MNRLIELRVVAPQVLLCGALGCDHAVIRKAALPAHASIQQEATQFQGSCSDYRDLFGLLGVCLPCH